MKQTSFDRENDAGKKNFPPQFFLGLAVVIGAIAFLFSPLTRAFGL